MKLASPQVHKTLNQYDAQALPDNHPAMPELNQRFGNHTFFVDDNGLNIVEPAEPTAAGVPAGTVVNVASWADAERTSLTVHSPEATDIVVELGEGPGHTA